MILTFVTVTISIWHQRRWGVLVSFWSSDVLTWRKCCRCAKGLVQREVTQGLEMLLLSALSEGRTSSAPRWWSGRRMICLLLWAWHESSVINYNFQHHSPVCRSCKDQAVMQIEERSNVLCLQETGRPLLGNPAGNPKQHSPSAVTDLTKGFFFFFKDLQCPSVFLDWNIFFSHLIMQHYGNKLFH